MIPRHSPQQPAVSCWLCQRRMPVRAPFGQTAIKPPRPVDRVLRLHVTPLLAQDAAIEAMQEDMMFSEYASGFTGLQKDAAHKS